MKTTDLRGRRYLEASSDAIVETGPAGHVGGHVDVPAVQVHHGVPRGGAAWTHTITPSHLEDQRQ